MITKENRESQEILTAAHHDFEKGLNARAFLNFTIMNWGKAWYKILL